MLFYMKYLGMMGVLGGAQGANDSVTQWCKLTWCITVFGCEKQWI